MTEETNEIKANDAVAGLNKRIVMPFDHLAIGARFRYKDGGKTWIKLDGHGLGKVAEYDPVLITHESWIGQIICSAKDVDGEDLTVIFEA